MSKIRINYLLVCAVLLVSSGKAIASDPDIRTYMLSEPVFNGEAYILEAGDSNKPLVVLVHGLGDRAAETWRRFIPELSRDYHVITFDLPGFGRSSKANKLYSPDNYVRFINFILSKHRHSSFTMIGHSMGGNIALRYAASYPQRVDRLLLVDAAGVLHRLAYVDFLRHFGIRIIPQFYPEQKQDLEWVTDLLLAPLKENTDLFEAGEELILHTPTLRENILGGEPSTISAYAMMMTEYSRELDNFIIPVMIVWGEQDAVTPIRTGKVLAGKMKNSGLIIIARAGHNPMDEAYEEFIVILRKFLKSDRTMLDNWIDKNRYHSGDSKIGNTDKIIQCKNKQGQVITGSYRKVLIRNCQNIRLANVHAESIKIIQSKVTIEDATIINSTGSGLIVNDSDVIITSTDVTGNPAISTMGSRLNLAGVSLKSDNYALKNPSGAGEASSSFGSQMLFSVSKINSKFIRKYLHGPVILRAGEGM